MSPLNSPLLPNPLLPNPRHSHSSSEPLVRIHYEVPAEFLKERKERTSQWPICSTSLQISGHTSLVGPNYLKHGLNSLQLPHELSPVSWVPGEQASRAWTTDKEGNQKLAMTPRISTSTSLNPPPPPPTFTMPGSRPMIPLVTPPFYHSTHLLAAIALVVYNHWTGMVEWNSGMCSTG